MMSDLETLFSLDQRMRARALDAARAVLVQRGALSSSAPSSVVDLITVAQWILDGQDPWPEEKDAEPVIRICDHRGNVIREIRDDEEKENPDAEPGREPADEGVEAAR